MTPDSVVTKDLLVLQEKLELQALLENLDQRVIEVIKVCQVLQGLLDRWE